MPASSSYDYAILRVIPDLGRGENINIGVILFCRTRRFLGMLLHIDVERLRILAPQLDVPALEQQLEHLLKICYGKEGSGPIGELPQSERFHWLVAPRSTIIQTSPTHSGMCSDPEVAMRDLLKKLVL